MLLARGARGHLEFGVAMSIRLLAVRRQEIGEPRPQVSTDVPDDDRDAVRVGIDERVEVIVRDLRDGALGERSVIPVHPDHVLEIRGSKIRGHGSTSSQNLLRDGFELQIRSALVNLSDLRVAI